MVKSLKKSGIKYAVKELEKHSDQRGWLVEVLKRNELKEDIKQIYVATIKPGNHYHLKRIEWFFVIGGKTELYLEDLKTKEKIYLKLSSKKPKVISIFPKTAHAVRNSSKKTIYLVSVQNTIYDFKNSDTYPYLVCK